MPWYAVVLFALSGQPGWSSRYCRECAGGRNFIAMLVAGLVLGLAFLIAVIIW